MIGGFFRDGQVLKGPQQEIAGLICPAKKEQNDKACRGVTCTMHHTHPASSPPPPLPHLSPVKPNVPSKHVCRQGSCDCANSKAAVWLTIFLSSPPVVCMSHCCCPVTSRRPNTHIHTHTRRVGVSRFVLVRWSAAAAAAVGACRPSAGLGLRSQFRGRCGRCGRPNRDFGWMDGKSDHVISYSCSLSSSSSSSSPGPRIPGKVAAGGCASGLHLPGTGRNRGFRMVSLGVANYEADSGFLISLPPELIQICVAATDYLSAWG
ncbi:hypothetical protein B0I37DRAFT_175797 [Chaetomium sp. MPI-CAGE-AT-0009]|nr:hypothetical protein B0I37DRAFT_175797 [Chaetomium sp. MPI-CAGE-AT-0009]